MNAFPLAGLIGSVFLFLGVLPSLSAQQTEQPVVRFGVVIDGPWFQNDYVRGLFESEITELLEREFDVRFPAEKRLVADWTLPGVTAAVDQLLGDPDVDVFLAVGPVSSQVVATRTNLPKPSLAAFVLDAEMQGLPIEDGGSGVQNLSYVSLPLVVEEGIETFRSLVSFDTLVFLANPDFLAATPTLGPNVQQAARALGISVTVIPATPPASNALGLLPADAEAIYLAPLLNFDEAEWTELIDSLTARRLPTFSTLGAAEVERGVFASIATEDFFPRVARRAALNVQRILLGEDAATLPVAFSAGRRLTVNMATARAIEEYPPWTVLMEAVLLNEDTEDVARTLSLEIAVKEAVDVNLDLLAEDRAVAAGAQDIADGRSVLLPQLDVYSTLAVIDGDRAAASLGSQTQRSLVGGARLSQTVLVEPAWANVSIQSHLQQSRVENREALRLDIALEAAAKYLLVMQAKTSVTIQRNNLSVTRSNLELARVRNSIGQSSPGEVFRWESELANARIAVLDAEKNRSISETALNRILDRPQEELFATIEPSLGDPALLTSDPRLFLYVDNRRLFEIFRDFWVHEGLTTSPELKQIDAGLAAQERSYASSNRSFWLPTIGLEANLFGLLATGGAGTDFGNGPPDASNPFGGLVQPNDLSWILGVEAALPLFEGGSRFAQRSQALEQVAQLRLERESAATKIEQRIRSALHELGASYPTIALANQAAVAARRNLQLVTDSYARGVVSIIDLLDAQNAAISADELAANAVYDFLIDLMELERAIGRFDFFMTAEQKEAVFDRMRAFYEAAGIRPPNL